MTRLDSWLERATRCLSANSSAQVRSEITEHYESARESAMNSGENSEDADRLAVAALGDAKVANRAYRKVLLTAPEARLLRQGNWEARAVCSNSWVKVLLLAGSVACIFAGNEMMLRGATGDSRMLFLLGAMIGLLFVAPFLPVYTPGRARVFRVFKWALLLAVLFVPYSYKWSWLTISTLWPLVAIEWARMTIRRKLPVSEWPKQLYL